MRQWDTNYDKLWTKKVRNDQVKKVEMISTSKLWNGDRNENTIPIWTCNLWNKKWKLGSKMGVKMWNKNETVICCFLWF